MANLVKKTIIRRERAKIDSFQANFEGKEYKYSVQEPTFEQLSAALSESLGVGKLNMAGGGKVIWELCVFEHSEGITENVRILMAICLDLYNNYALPAEVLIKKN